MRPNFDLLNRSAMLFAALSALLTCPREGRATDCEIKCITTTCVYVDPEDKRWYELGQGVRINSGSGSATAQMVSNGNTRFRQCIATAQCVVTTEPNSLIGLYTTDCSSPTGIWTTTERFKCEEP